MKITNRDINAEDNSFKILSLMLSTNAIFTGPSIFITYGMMHGILFGIAVIFAFVLSYLSITFLVKYSKKDIKPLGLDRGFKMYYLVYSFTQFFMIGLGGGIITSIILQIPLIVGIGSFFILAYFYAYINRLPHFRHQLKLAALFLVTTYLLLFTYITEDVKGIYSGIRLYHPYLLYVDWNDFFIFTLAVCIIFMSKVFTSHTYINQVVEKKISFKTALLIGASWASLSISFIVISFSVIYKGGFESTYTIFSELFFRIDNTFLTIIAAILLFTLTDTFRMEAEHLEDLGFNRKKYIALFLPIIIVLVLINENWSHLHYLFFLFGIWSTAFLPVLTANLFKQKAEKPIGIKIGLISALAGYSSFIWLEFTNVVLFTFAVSVVLVLVMHKKYKGLS